MKITVDTEKDSKDDINSAIRLLQKIIGEEAASEAEAVKVKDAGAEAAGTEKAEEKADELLSLIAGKNKAEKGSEEGGEEKDLPGVPKSVKEAYELAEDLETY
ncbi:hypothetical protein HYV82_02360 [Candidatus Woesearchaeota archaeon]|nr:hypothetical protein [Candidatus Woesearchaeota archaeon]